MRVVDRGEELGLRSVSRGKRLKMVGGEEVWTEVGAPRREQGEEGDGLGKDDGLDDMGEGDEKDHELVRRDDVRCSDGGLCEDGGEEGGRGRGTGGEEGYEER
ncbi:hypothetical protein Tco_0044265 [Tanacetum coccineum]